ncbi:MAG: class I SAM-dependent methyltransferase [Acidobacteria bacterium]|nr:class I SAM-dependent methyltransferase [Acidobacteriota bacterium]
MMDMDTEALARMRRDWDERAMRDALYYIYTEGKDESDFERSGRANYDQLVRPFLPVLLRGRGAKSCRVLEIGCGAGRMTRHFAAEFLEVHGVDVSERMIELARERLRDCPNAFLHAGSGCDLRGLANASFDLAFSYIVFQHIPTRPAIENYVREAARVLKPGGAFKFQLNGDQSPEYRAHERDTWLGETFSHEEACAMLARSGFSLLAAEGAGTQYFVLTARKGHAATEPELRPYIFPGEAWAEKQLLEGWGDAVDDSWRPMEARSRARLAVPSSGPLRFYMGFYVWPDDRPELRVSLSTGGSAVVRGSGDHYLEFAVPRPEDSAVEIGITIEPKPLRPPALRALGLY